jgi:hypothetical protein
VATAAVPRTLLAARRTVVAIFVLVMLFWSVAVYAQARGVREAARVAATISRRPDVTVYSARRLHLAGPTIQETELRGPDTAYRFRYTGLKLVVRSGASGSCCRPPGRRATAAPPCCCPTPTSCGSSSAPGR